MAPSNAAFDNIPYTALNGVWDPDNKDKTVPILQYHILTEAVATKSLSEVPAYLKRTLLTDPKYTNVTDGQNIIINKQAGNAVVFTSGQGTRCTLEQADIAFQGGVIQMVDNFLIPPGGIDKTAQAFQATSFLGSLFAAKLMPNVSYEKSVTIFAPRDAAFAAVGGTLQRLNSSKLANIMDYHVVPGKVMTADDLTNGTKLTTLSGGGSSTGSLMVRQDGNNKYVNSAQIVQPNILIANGIVHLISNVLNPDVEDTIPNGQQPSQPPVFAVSTVSGVFTSALPCTTNCPVTSSNGASGSATANATANATSTSVLFTSSSDGAVAPRCTAHVAGAAIGVLGLGAGMAWL